MEKKVALITGCSSGIGQALSFELKNRGWQVYSTARKVESLKPLTDIGCLGMELDTTNPNQIITVVKTIIEKEKRIDLLINNAGYGSMGPSVEISLEETERQFATNLFGPLELIKQVAPVMKAQKSGMIVNTGSISGIVATPFSGPYCASKAAIHSYSDVLRMELAPFRIKVITVQPGAIASNFGKNADQTVTRALKPGSWYESINEFVHKRAYTSQESTTPVDVFANRLVSKILKKNPPSVIKFGKKSFLLPFLKKILPVSILDNILSKRFGLKNLKE
jgi:short-subunit dehydrogenase